MSRPRGANGRERRMDEFGPDPRRQPQAFGGQVAPTVAGSTPWWPSADQPRRPNVVVILLDDVGFAQLGCYGSSIATSHIDALAAGGLRYTNFHATALCSPTRASLLTGRNHHSVGMGFLAAFDTGFPSYRGQVSHRAATMAEILRDEGFGTYAVGKWHLIPPGHLTAAGPFHHWPTQRGFDRYYGFLGGEEDHWAPELWYDQHLVDPPDDEDYHLSEDLVSRAEGFLDDHITSRPDDPFLLYAAFGACHAPHQAPRSFIDAYAGKFDHGWDVERTQVLERQVAMGIVPDQTELAPRNPGVAAWNELDAQQQRVYARMQEVFAGFMTHTDAQIGRLIDHLDRARLLDDTIVVLMSDNGASGEGGVDGTANEYRWFLRLPDSLDDTLAVCDELGGPTTHGHYPLGWAQAGNTPTRFYKRHAYGGGVRVPFIVHWPNRIGDRSSLREQFHHVTDVMPTLLELCSASAPGVYRGIDQIPVHGTSMAYTFDDPAAPSTHEVQYFETAGHRGIVANGWKAVASHQPGDSFDDDHWELYRLFEDFSECHDVADRHPEKVVELRELWWDQAREYAVLPLDDRMQTRMMAQNPSRDALRYEMRPGTRLLNNVAGPNFFDRSFRVTAHVGPWRHGHEGVLLAWGHRATGMSLFVKDSRLNFDLNLGGRHRLVGADPTITQGAIALELILQGDEHGAVATLLVDGDAVGVAAIPRLIPGGMGLLPTQCGYNAPSPVSPEYTAPFRYRGELERVVVDLEPRHRDVDATDWLAALNLQ